MTQLRNWLFLLLLFIGAAGFFTLPTNVSAAPAYTTQQTTYVVQRGDTLSRIAQQHGTTVAAIQRANNLLSDRIYVGQRLVIPGSVDPNQPSNGTIYIVQAGDNLSRIALRYGTTVTAIKSANNLLSDRIYVGQRLLIPSGNAPVPTPIPSSIYTVQSGDTLSGIARRFGTTVAAIKAANNLISDRIFVGQRLIIATDYNTPLPQPQRIQFAAGSSSATVSGTSSQIVPGRYVLRAAAGQMMSVNVVSDVSYNSLLIRHPNGTVLGETSLYPLNWSGRLPVSGDYYIEIFHNGTGLANITLNVSIVTDGQGIPFEPTFVRSVTALQTVRVRSGPGLNYSIIGAMRGGEVAFVTGKSLDGNWWRINCTNVQSGVCWVSANPNLTSWN